MAGMSCLSEKNRITGKRNYITESRMQRRQSWSEGKVKAEYRNTFDCSPWVTFPLERDADEKFAFVDI
jgi:hypothetical protein